MMTPAPQDQTTARIAVNVAGKIYGPYSLAQFKTYVVEGRITRGSLISRDGGQWVSVAADEICKPLFAAEPQTASAPVEAPVDHGVERRIAPRETVSTSSARQAFLKEVEGISPGRTIAFAANTLSERRSGAPDRRVSDESIVTKVVAQARADVEPANFLLIFDVKSRHHGKLEEAIMDLGPATRILPGIWVLHGPYTCASIRNQVLEHFGKLDSLFIVDATHDKLAWFNLGPEADSQIRQVWKRSDR